MPGSPLLVPFVKGLIVVSGTLGLLLTSGLVVQGLITWITRKESQEEGSPRVPPVDRRTRDVGSWRVEWEKLAAEMGNKGQ